MSNAFLDSLRVRREELPLALLMFGYFFLVITCFWILKPIKKGLFIEFYDQTGFDLLGLSFSAAQAELLAVFEASDATDIGLTIHPIAGASSLRSLIRPTFHPHS